jgi:hypothetical protein
MRRTWLHEHEHSHGAELKNYCSGFKNKTQAKRELRNHVPTHG